VHLADVEKVPMINMAGDDHSYVTIWGWLLGLLIAGVFVFTLHLATVTLLFIIFGVAAIKAILVVRNYMHLKAEHVLIYAIAGIPILLVIGMLLALIPDIVFHR
jgi:cytochrome c oxidase subunit IV